MAVRIQLASNFQVIELTYDNWAAIDPNEIIEAQQLVNEFGQNVHNDIKTKESKKEEEMATEGQIKFLIKLGMKEAVAKTMTKKQAWQYIQDNK